MFNPCDGCLLAAEAVSHVQVVVAQAQVVAPVLAKQFSC